MIVLDNNAQVTEWLKERKIDCSGITRIDVATFELAKGFETELLIVEDVVYLQMNDIVKDKLNDSEAVLLFRSQSTPIGQYISNIVGEISVETPIAVLENQIQFFEGKIRESGILKSQMISLNHELIETMGDVDLQLKRVKKEYEAKTPKRLEEFKGVVAMSKYAAGEDIGGEFFDLFSFDNKAFVLMSSCSSYLASSSLLQFFSEMKSHQKISKELELEFLAKTHAEVKKINENKKKPVKVEILTGVFDMASLSFCGHKFGDFQFISSRLDQKIDIENMNLANPEKSYFEVSLERGERILLNSPGFQKNWNVAKPEFLMEELIIDPKVKPLDLLDEIYFTLKKKTLNGFLTFDASSIIVEVKQNVMVQI